MQLVGIKSHLNQGMTRYEGSSYKKYSVRRFVVGGTCRSRSDTAEKMVNLGSRSSLRFMMEATLPQR